MDSLSELVNLRADFLECECLRGDLACRQGGERRQSAVSASQAEPPLHLALLLAFALAAAGAEEAAGASGNWLIC